MHNFMSYLTGAKMAQDNTTTDADGYYGDEDVQDEELDLSFLDEDDESKPKS